MSKNHQKFLENKLKSYKVRLEAEKNKILKSEARIEVISNEIYILEGYLAANKENTS